MTRSFPPHSGPVSMSIADTRFRRCIPVLALLVCLAFLASATWENRVAGLVALGMGVALYFLPGLGSECQDWGQSKGTE